MYLNNITKSGLPAILIVIIFIDDISCKARNKSVLYENTQLVNLISKIIDHKNTYNFVIFILSLHLHNICK